MKIQTMCAAMLLSAATLLLCGCSSTPRGLQHSVTRPMKVEDAPQSVMIRGFAENLGSHETGSTLVVPGTPIGTARVTLLDDYVNGLGEACKRFSAEAGSRRLNGTVCRTAEGVWRYVPPLN